MIDGEGAQALAEGYVAYMASGDDAVMEMFSSAFFDNVSGRSGLDIFKVVRVWMDESFDQRSAELHLVTHTEDTVVIWYTVRRRRIGNGFPRLVGRPVQRQCDHLAPSPHLPSERRTGGRTLGCS